MSASSTSRRRRPGGRHGGSWTLAPALAVLCGIGVLRAVDPDRAPSQYLRQTWGNETGYQGGAVHAITQTADGYLWIGGERGLVRFDGLTFRLFQYDSGPTNAGPNVLGVLPTPDGGLWARLRGPALIAYRGGAIDNVLPILRQPDTVVTAMLRTRNDAIVIATLGSGIMTYRNGRLEMVVPQDRMPGSFPISMAEAADGTLWLGTRDTGLFHLRDGRAHPIVDGVPDEKINCLLPTADGGLWIGTDNGVVRWNGRAITTDGVPAALRHVRALTMIEDRDGNLWIGSTSNGLLRLNRRGDLSSDDSRRGSADDVTALFEDRDGNLWVGTARGLERIRDGVFTTYSTAQGLPANNLGPVHVDAAQRIWVAGAAGGLSFIHDGRVSPVDLAALTRDVVYSIAGGADDIWLGRQRGGLTRITWNGEALAARSYTQAEGLAQNSVYAVHRASDGAIWAGTLSGGVSRFDNGRFTTYSVADGLGSNTVFAIAETADRTMWFGTPNGLSALANGRWRHYTTSDGLPSNEVNTLHQDARSRLWIGTAAGPAIAARAGMTTPAHVPSPLRASILGMADDGRGAMWIATADRIMRVDRDRLADGLARDAEIRTFGPADGLIGVEGVKRQRSVVADAAGRIWFSTNAGLSMTDPPRAFGRIPPALAHVESVAADGRPIALADTSRIPARPQRITFTYAGLSLAVPERVAFRYRLDGFDADWSAPKHEREAVYTNLGPGPYRFRVLASNSDGLWSGPETAIDVVIAPAFWQTAWFQGAAALGIAALGWAAYRVRVRQMSRRLHERFEERLAERTRIAQELHDTLLQGFVSASMQLHVASDRLPEDSAAKPQIVRVLDLMRRVIDEGRNAVRGLRSPAVPCDDLEAAFSSIQQEVAPDRGGYRVIVEGRQRPLNPIIRDEVYRIGREALVNAFRHADAEHVELELEYAGNHLRLLVRDDGRGIDAPVLASGSDGHWGLPGMRERAERIGARLKVWSRAAAGTEIELSVPGHIAFHETGGDRPARRAATDYRARGIDTEE